ncbi:element excision factor XisI family protein [Nostoc sp.]|uniref:element excision factor XisI family protein n=1 Tax=Nostoc sp. TaxID=1180 RepID=UPI003FA59279
MANEYLNTSAFTETTSLPKIYGLMAIAIICIPERYCFMEGINYSQIIQDILSTHCANDVANGTEVQLLLDAERHHYQVLSIGWKEQRRIYGVIQKC